MVNWKEKILVIIHAHVGTDTPLMLVKAFGKQLICLIIKIVFNPHQIITIYIYRSLHSIIRMWSLEKYHQNCTETWCISSELS